MRAAMLKTTGIETTQRILSQEIQRRYQGSRYSIEVVTLEVFPSIYLPLNNYVPNNRDPRTCLLVITPPTFAQGASLKLV